MTDMKKINVMAMSDHADIFATEVSPALSLMDPAGRRYPILDASCANSAIDAAETLFLCGGAGKQTLIQEVANTDKDIEDPRTFGLYYVSHAGRPSKAEITRVARVINRSAVVVERGPESFKVSGGRSIVFPDQTPQNSTAVPFLISTLICYNANRVTGPFPYTEAQLDLVVTDINNRLTEGYVAKMR